MSDTCDECGFILDHASGHGPSGDDGPICWRCDAGIWKRRYDISEADLATKKAALADARETLEGLRNKCGAGHICCGLTSQIAAECLARITGEGKGAMTEQREALESAAREFLRKQPDITSLSYAEMLARFALQQLESRDSKVIAEERWRLYVSLNRNVMCYDGAPIITWNLKQWFLQEFAEEINRFREMSPPSGEACE